MVSAETFSQSDFAFKKKNYDKNCKSIKPSNQMLMYINNASLCWKWYFFLQGFPIFLQECFYVFLVGVITVLRIWNGKNPLHNTPVLPTQLLYSKMNLKPSGAQPACQPSGRTVIGGDQNGLDQWERSISTSGTPASILPPVSTGKYLVEYFLSEIQLNTKSKFRFHLKIRPRWQNQLTILHGVYICWWSWWY